MMIIFFVLRESPDKFGLALSSSKRIWAVVVVLFAGLFILMLTVSHWQVFQNYYPLFRHYPEFGTLFAGYPAVNPWNAGPSAWALMAYAEASYAMYLFCWEFFFRGFLLFGLKRTIGWWAVLVQAIAFGLLHYGKPMPEVASSFIAGIILGIIALNAKSIVPCFLLHWVASLSFDVMVIAARPH